MNKHLFDSDYSYDSMRWIETYKSLDGHKINYSGDKKLDKIQENIIADKDAALAYFFSLDTNYKTYKMQEVIIKKGEPKYALLFAKHIQHADVQALQNLVLESKNIKYITKFGCEVCGADKKKIESIIIKENNARYAHMFLKNVPGANIKKLKKIVLDAKKPRYLFELAKHLSSRKEISKIEDLIIQSQSFTYMRLLAQKNKLANIAKLEQAVLESGNAKEIKKFAKVVKKSKLRGLTILF